MKTVQSTTIRHGTNRSTRAGMRLLAISATIPNVEDVSLRFHFPKKKVNMMTLLSMNFTSLKNNRWETLLVSQIAAWLGGIDSPALHYRYRLTARAYFKKATFDLLSSIVIKGVRWHSYLWPQFKCSLVFLYFAQYGRFISTCEIKKDCSWIHQKQQLLWLWLWFVTEL